MYKGGAVSAPSRYGALISVMREMHWSWADLMSAPADLVEEIVARITAQAHWTREKANYDEAMRLQNV